MGQKEYKSERIKRERIKSESIKSIAAIHGYFAH